MKNLLESFAILLVGVLSLLIIFLIVQYNMIEEEAEEIVFTIPVKTKESKKAKTSSYLDSLEGYGEDVDVKVDATKESTANTVAVQSELSSDELGSAIADKSKSSYMENLENYAEPEPEVKAAEPVKEEVAAEAPKDPEDPEKLAEDEIEDEIGMAIDAALDDL